jgi:hypothetical protein
VGNVLRLGFKRNVQSTASNPCRSESMLSLLFLGKLSIN